MVDARTTSFSLPLAHPILCNILHPQDSMVVAAPGGNRWKMVRCSRGRTVRGSCGCVWTKGEMWGSILEGGKLVGQRGAVARSILKESSIKGWREGGEMHRVL